MSEQLFTNDEELTVSFRVSAIKDPTTGKWIATGVRRGLMVKETADVRRAAVEKALDRLKI